MMRFHIGPVSLGAVTFGREIDEETSFRILDHAVAHGIRLIDTAEVYGGGASETIIGRWLARSGARRDVVIQTKLSRAFDPESTRRAVQGSLERLGADTIDVYLLHRRDPLVPLEETWSALAAEVATGRITALGCSNFALADLEQARALDPPIETTQPPYSLAAREIESEILPWCQANEVSVIPYSPLAAGFLTGKYTPDRAAFPPGTRFDLVPGHADIYFTERNFTIVERLRALAARTGVPMTKLAMSWVFANRALRSVLIGARSTAQVDNALDAARFDFPPEWLAEIASW